MFKVLDEKEHAVSIGQMELNRANKTFQWAAAAAESTVVSVTSANLTLPDFT